MGLSGTGLGGGMGSAGGHSAAALSAQSILASIEIIPGGLLPVGQARPAPDAKTAAKYGLMGMLDMLRANDREANILALGTDLNSLGLNLNSGDFLYPSFSSPFDEGSGQASEPKYNIPPCYIMPISPNLKQEHITKFLIETLFYMFYSMPRDIMQVRAAVDLYRREWKYHGELKIWVRQRTPAELASSMPNAQFQFFDVTDWKEKAYTVPNRAAFVAGLLSEEDIRGGQASPRPAGSGAPGAPASAESS